MIRRAACGCVLELLRESKSYWSKSRQTSRCVYAINSSSRGWLDCDGCCTLLTGLAFRATPACLSCTAPTLCWRCKTIAVDLCSLFLLQLMLLQRVRMINHGRGCKLLKKCIICRTNTTKVSCLVCLSAFYRVKGKCKMLPGIYIRVRQPIPSIHACFVARIAQTARTLVLSSGARVYCT